MAHGYESTEPLVLHVDVDAFFCQVEVLRRAEGPSLRGVPLAVQQHQDIIAVDYSARQAGVQKHMAPAEARRLLSTVGGRVVHVYCEDGTRPSYRPYRETSAAFLRLLRGLLPPGGVMEAASIDEAYIQLGPRPTGRSAGKPKSPNPHLGPRDTAFGAAAGEGGAADVGAGGDAVATAAAAAAADPWVSDPWVSEAVQLGERIRREIWSQLGLRVSVGLSRNKLLAKWASRAAKPDGLRVLLGEERVEQALRSTPVSRLPGLGGRAAEALAAAGYVSAVQLRPLSATQLVSDFGLRAAAAECVVAWCRGEDPRPVRERGPPKSIQVQMSLTVVPRPAPPALLARAVNARSPAAAPGTTATALAATATAEAEAEAAAGSPAGMSWGSAGSPTPVPMLMPLLPDSAEGRVRLQRLVRSMAGDLVARVLLDRHQERRWPGRLTVQLVTHGSVSHGSVVSALETAGRTASKTCSFPSPALASTAARAAIAASASAGKAAGGAVADSSPPPPPAAAAAATMAAADAGVTAAAAAAVPPGAGGGGLIVGEHTFYRPGSQSPLLDAVVAAALELCWAVLAAPPVGGSAGAKACGAPVERPMSQVHLTAHSFVPYGTAAAAAPISHFLSGGGHGGGIDEPRAAKKRRRTLDDQDGATPPAATTAVAAAAGTAGTAAAAEAPFATGAAGPWGAAAAGQAAMSPPLGRGNAERRTAPRPGGEEAAATTAISAAAAAAATAAAVATTSGPGPPLPQPPAQPQPRPRAPVETGAAGRQLRSRPRQLPRQLPAQVNLLGLLGAVWRGDGGRRSEGAGAGVGAGGSGGSGAVGRGAEAAAEAAVQRMDAWVALFGAGPLEEWWRDLGVERPRQEE
ncbi:hypothetical protein PLESTF_000884600 [Pleodorina starrii]|nr:hypothetical protein PLESTM_000938900 [Pleodorina starrii]GLC69825.1 hypothetical protein PLESTF_000884600 [Pleodorina starrii]